MKKTDGSFGNIWTVAGLFLSSLVGAGFATGREVFVYFAAFGFPGAAGFIFSCFLLFGASCRILSVVGAGTMTRIHQLPRFLAGRGLAVFFTGSIILFSFCGYVTMMAGFRDVVASLLPPVTKVHGVLSGLCACGIVTAFSLLILYRGFQRFAVLCRILTPFLIVCIAVAAAIAAFQSHGSWTVVSFKPKMTAALLLRTLLYTGYNLLFVVSVLGRAGGLGANRETSRRGSLLGAVLFLLGGMGIFMALLRMDEKTAQSAMPLCSVVQELGETPGVFFSCILALAMLLCAASGLGATANAMACKHRTRKILSEKGVGTVLALFAIPLSYAGFDVIISFIYPLFGLVGIFLLAVLAQTRGKNV